MRARSSVAASCAAGLLSITSMFTLAGAAMAAAPSAGVPLGVDAVALTAASTGVVVATGTLEDGAGHPTPGLVAVLAWPNETFNRTLGPGSSVPTPTVGWARTAADGSFTVRVDPTSIGADYVSANGIVNFTAIGWTSKSQGIWMFPAQVRNAAATPARVTIPVDRPLVSSTTSLSSTTQGGPGGGISPQACMYVLQSSYDAMATVGRTIPYGSDTGWMSSQSSQTITVGAAASSSGTYGSWSQSGTTSTTMGVTFTWAESTAYRSYSDQLRYGKYRLYCNGLGANDYTEIVQYPTGGYGNASIGWSSYANCAPVPAGVWQRDSSSGNHFAMSAGVAISALLGINLSSDANYSSTHIIYYRLAAAGKVCGDNAVPALASNINTNR